ncbi:MAG: DUF512 domain-containing protein [Desulfitobacteriaceae bacterium]
MPQGLVVGRVLPRSIAEELGIFPGDEVLAVDGQAVKDIIDFQYLTAEDTFNMMLQKEGEVWEYEIERDPEEFLGLEFEKVSTEGLKLCRNNCVFCFISQMPSGMRETLYAKDDDYRLSLTQGSFITLSNLTEEEFARILSLHLSPLYISVHAWKPEIRVKLMKNPLAGKIDEQLTRLAEDGISIHAQIVLVPGYNDGKILADTVEHLGALYPSVQSIAVVPVGLTRFREGLPSLHSFSKTEATEILIVGEKWQREFQTKFDRHLLYFADEFYVLAGWEFPEAEVYDDFPQLENGVGMASKFVSEMLKVWEELPERIPQRQVHIITGVSAEGFFRKWQKRLQERIHGLDIMVHGITNVFFGSEVTAAGLLTAGDIARQLVNLKGAEFIIPRVMLKSDEDLFLDDRDVAWLETQVQGNCLIADNNGVSFLESVIGVNLGGDEFE